MHQLSPRQQLIYRLAFWYLVINGSGMALDFCFQWLSHFQGIPFTGRSTAGIFALSTGLTLFTLAREAHLPTPLAVEPQEGTELIDINIQPQGVP